MYLKKSRLNHQTNNHFEQLSTWKEAGTVWWGLVRLAFLCSYFHYHSLSLSGETNFKTSWSICSVKIGPLDIFRLADSAPHHLRHDLGKLVGLVGFGIKQALRFFFLRWVWGWLSSFAELYWTWLSFSQKECCDEILSSGDVEFPFFLVNIQWDLSREEAVVAILETVACS